VETPSGALAHLVTRSDRRPASGAPTCPVSSGRSMCEGVERADDGRGTLARPMHFCEVADAGDRT
jgi:hypothetical protein